MKSKPILVVTVALATIVGAGIVTAIQAGAGRSTAPPRPKGPVTSTPPPATPAWPRTAPRARCTPPTTARSTRSCASRTARPWTSASSSPSRRRSGCGRIRQRGRAGRVLRQHVLLDHHHLRPVRPSTTTSPRRRAADSAARPWAGSTTSRSPTWRRSRSWATRPTASSSRRAWASARTTPKGTAVDDQAEGQYWVINGHHYNSGCCFDYGNAETDSRDDGNGTMETTYYGNATAWYHGHAARPVDHDRPGEQPGRLRQRRMASKLCADLPSITWRFVTAMAKGEPHHWTLAWAATRSRAS